MPAIASAVIRRASLRPPPARRIRTSIRASLETSRRSVAARVRQRAVLRAQIFFDESVAERIRGGCADVAEGMRGVCAAPGVDVRPHADVLVVPVASARLDSLPAASTAVRPMVWVVPQRSPVTV